MRNKVAGLLVVIVLVLLAAVPAYADDPEVKAVYVYSDIPLAELQNQAFPGSIPNDRGILLGGVGSDMFHVAGDPANVFYVITDRGPNGQIRVDDKNRRTFPVPEFTPLILKIQLDDPDKVTILESFPIVTASGEPATGLSALPRDEKPYDYTAQNELERNPNGIDSEGLVRAPNGDFWIVEEYGPSIMRLDSTGKIIKRYVPEGIEWQGSDSPVANVLPSIYEKRKGNRGFEGLAISPDGATLFAVLQSPLSNPDADTGDVSRNTRILAFDIAGEKAIAEYVYELDIAAEFDPESPDADEMKLSGAIAVSPTELYILERTDKVAKIYSVDLTKGTDILGTAWDDLETSPSLEAVTDLAAAGVTPLPKTLVVDLDALSGMPDKIEGISLPDAGTLTVANDNDFDMNGATFDADGNIVAQGSKSQVLSIKLPASTTEPAGTSAPLPNTGGTFESDLRFVLFALVLVGLGLLVRRLAKPTH